MPILSYLVLPKAGAMEQLCTDLSAMECCEVIPSDNEEVVVLVLGELPPRFSGGQSTVDQFLELPHQITAMQEGLVLVDDHAERVHRISVHEDVEADELVRPHLDELVVEPRVAPRTALEAVVEVEHDLRERQLEV